MKICLLSNDTYLWEFNLRSWATKYFNHYGIFFTNKIELADIGIITNINQLGNFSKPILYLLSIDSLVLTPDRGSRILLDDRITTIYCRYSYRNNYKTINGRLSNIDNRFIKKFCVGGGLLYAPELFETTKYYYPYKRIYDVNYIYRADYPFDFVNVNKLLCLTGIPKNICSFIFQGSYSGIRLPFPDYIKSILQSKITISSLGTCEDSHRDWIALLCGSILIKPNIDYFETFPDIYNNNHYIPCKHDYSDLPDKIHYVLENYEEIYEQMGHRQARLFELQNRKTLAKLYIKSFYETLRSRI